MTAQDGANVGAATSGEEFPDANSGLNAVDLEQADAEVAGEAPADAGVAASDSADEALSAVGDIDQDEPEFGNADVANGSADLADNAGESETDNQVAELTNDLQRINAEYANFRKRSEERSRIVGEVAVAGVLSELLPILDDLDRAQEHGEYDGALKSIGDSLQGVVTKLGLTKFGETGEAFDPSIHEGLMTVEAQEGQEPQSVGQILRPGYKINDRVIRTAGVAVTQ